LLAVFLRRALSERTQTPKAVEKAKQNIARRQIPNVTAISAPLHGRLPFDAGSFDKVVSVLTFHDRTPDEKLGISKEMLRVLRRGGTLHVADFDKPATRGERRILIFAERVLGRTAAEPHMNGSWMTILPKVGFLGIRCQSSFSVGVGRIIVGKARKR
jgi:SAM-dependent methyltransferase